MPESVVSHLMKALRQDVHQESAEELDAGQAARPPLARSRCLYLKVTWVSAMARIRALVIAAAVVHPEPVFAISTLILMAAHLRGHAGGDVGERLFLGGHHPVPFSKEAGEEVAEQLAQVTTQGLAQVRVDLG